MGHNLYIGEAEPVIYLEDRIAYMGVEVVDGADQAPLNSSDDYRNYCYPGYLIWHEFAAQTGLYSTFYAPKCPNCSGKFPRHRGCDLCTDPKHGGHTSVWWVPEGKTKEEGMEGLLHNLPGCKALTEDHLTAFKAARETWMSKPDTERLDEDGVDWVLRRLDWLVFWTDWALKNCKFPSFANS